MSKLTHANSYRDLLVYQKARRLAMEVFQVSKAFPKEEVYALTDQLRRSSRSVGAQVAEAWAKRCYDKHFVSKLTDADGEQQETQHWIETAADCQYLNQQQAADLTEKCREIGRMLAGMIAKAELFCGQPAQQATREPLAQYFTDSPDD